jgi:hypothetical protein
VVTVFQGISNFRAFRAFRPPPVFSPGTNKSRLLSIYFPFHSISGLRLISRLSRRLPSPTHNNQPKNKSEPDRQTTNEMYIQVTFGFPDSAPSHLPSPIRTHTTHTLHTTTNQKIKIKIRTSTSRLPLPSQTDPLLSPTISHHLFSHTISHQNTHNNRLHLHLHLPLPLPSFLSPASLLDPLVLRPLTPDGRRPNIIHGPHLNSTRLKLIRNAHIRQLHDHAHAPR